MNMLKAIFTDGVDEITVHGLTQWDKGQKLQITISSLPASFQVHFANKRDDTAYVVEATASGGVATVAIPNLILHHRCDAVAWVYLSEGDSGETVKTINLPIQARAKPEGYAYTEVEILDYKTLDRRIDALEKGGTGGGSGSDSSQNANNTGWTTAQINLLNSLFSAIPWTTSTAGALADSLIASLRSTSSGGGTGGGSGGEAEDTETDNITQSGSTLTITSLATAPTQSGGVLTIA